jgi:hypothetical protein
MLSTATSLTTAADATYKLLKTILTDFASQSG